QTTTAIEHFYVSDVSKERIFQFSSTGNGLILGIDKATGKETWRTQEPRLVFDAGAVSADGSRIMVAGHTPHQPGETDRYYIGTIDVSTRKVLGTRSVAEQTHATYVASTGDGKNFWIGRQNGDLERMDSTTYQPFSHVQIKDTNVEAVY